MKKQLILSLLLTAALALASSFDIPKGWTKAGDHPENYDMGVDYGAGRGGKNAATIKSNAKKVRGCGVLMQSCLPGKYLGKRVRMTGYMRSENFDGLAFLWLRADMDKAATDTRGDKDEPVYMGGGGAYRSVSIGMSIDNKFEDRVKGTTGWRKCDIVIEIPRFASNLAYGAYMSGTGQIWFDGINFEEVDDTVPLTEPQKLQEPKNLNFDE